MCIAQSDANCNLVVEVITEFGENLELVGLHVVDIAVAVANAATDVELCIHSCCHSNGSKSHQNLFHLLLVLKFNLCSQ